MSELDKLGNLITMLSFEYLKVLERDNNWDRVEPDRIQVHIRVMEIHEPYDSITELESMGYGEYINRKESIKVGKN